MRGPAGRYSASGRVTMSAYYNEIDPFAAQWLRNLIAAGHIAPGDVDERSIEDVSPDDLRNYTQCHFFAGIGVWSYALRLAGWPDDRPVWTGSCPCQPFSSAGKGAGFDDERHLWPAWHWLIQNCRPVAIFGEQVASKNAGSWLDLVFADMEGLGYTGGGLAFPAAGVGAPHIRDRTYWAAYPKCIGHHGGGTSISENRPKSRGLDVEGRACAIERLANDERAGLEIRQRDGRVCSGKANEGQAAIGNGVGDAGGLDDTPGARHVGTIEKPEGEARNETRLRLPSEGLRQDRPESAGPVNGFWSDADWLFCRDGKWRPVEPGTFPLAYGLARSMGQLQPGVRDLAEVANRDARNLASAKANRVGRLKGYGNAIVATQAAEFIKAFMEVNE